MDRIAVDSLRQISSLRTGLGFAVYHRPRDERSARRSLLVGMSRNCPERAFTEFRNKTEISDKEIGGNPPKLEVLRQGLNTLRMAPPLPKNDRNRIRVE